MCLHVAQSHSSVKTTVVDTGFADVTLTQEFKFEGFVTKAQSSFCLIHSFFVFVFVFLLLIPVRSRGYYLSIFVTGHKKIE